MDYVFHWRPVFRELPTLLWASLETIEVAGLSMLYGTLIGLCLAFFKMSDKKTLRYFAITWIEIARNTPVLFQLFFFAFGLGAYGIHLSPYFVIISGITFNNAGYLAENFRGGFNAVPETQFKAARSLGLNTLQSNLYVRLPQVFRVVYYPMTNQLVWSVLMSSLAMLVGFHELSGATQALAFKTFRIFEFFLVTAGIYYIIVKILIFVFSLMGRRLFRY